MPNLNFRQILLIFTFAFLGHSAFANETARQFNRFYRNSFDGIYELSIATEKNKFRVGEDIDLTLTLQNNDQQTVYFVIDRYHDFDGYTIEVKTVEGKQVSPLKNIKNDGTPGIGSMMALEVTSEQSLKQFLRLTNLYEFEAGKYIVTISKTISVGYGRHKVDLKSNQMEIEVVAEETSNKSMDVRAKQLLSFGVVRYPKLACGWFRPTSSQPLCASWLLLTE